MLSYKTLNNKKAHAVCYFGDCDFNLLGGLCCYVVQATSSPKALKTIVIDAGHGGEDGGSNDKLTK